MPGMYSIMRKVFKKGINYSQKTSHLYFLHVMRLSFYFRFANVAFRRFGQAQARNLANIKARYYMGFRPI